MTEDSNNTQRIQSRLVEGDRTLETWSPEIVVRLTVTYGPESWLMNQDDQERLEHVGNER